MSELKHYGRLGMKWYQHIFGILDPRAKYSRRTSSNKTRIPKFNEASIYKEPTNQAQRTQEEINKKVVEGQRGVSSEARTIPKGTRIYRVTVNPNESIDGSKYVSYLYSDRTHYKGGWVRENNESDTSYEKEYTLVEDLKIPSRSELSDVIYKEAMKDKKTMNELGDKWLKNVYFNTERGYYELIEYMDENSTTANQWKKYVDNWVKEYKDMPISDAYYIAAQTFGINEKLKSNVISELKTRGYNAMTDEASVGGQSGWAREGSDPLIIFDAKSSLKEESTREITKDEEDYSLMKYNEWRKRADSSSGAWSDIFGGLFL